MFRQTIATGFLLLMAAFVAKGGPSPVAHANDQPTGKLIDHGKEAVLNRYVLNLGPLDLTSDGVREFKIRDLPQVDFLVGIDLAAPCPIDPSHPDPAWFDEVAVKLVLTETKTGRKIFEIDQKLGRYTWTNVSPVPGNSMLYGRDGVSSSFTPAAGAEYKLRVEVDSKAEKATEAGVYLTAMGNKGEAVRQRSWRGLIR